MTTKMFILDNRWNGWRAGCLLDLDGYRKGPNVINGVDRALSALGTLRQMKLRDLASIYSDLSIAFVRTD